METISSQTLTLFYCYAREDHLLREELEKHLAGLAREGLITGWYDGEIVAGISWEEEVKNRLNAADIILLLISADFIASDYCYSVEMKRALERHFAREARVIPIILRPVYWADTPFSELQALPTNMHPVISWADLDEAYADVARNIRRAVMEIIRQRYANDQQGLKRDEAHSRLAKKVRSAAYVSNPRNLPFPLSSVLALLARARLAPGKLFLFLGLVLLIIAGSVAFAVSLSHPATPPSSSPLVNASATATRPISYTEVTKHSPVFVDPLKDNSYGHLWLERIDDRFGSCFFKGEAYHVTANAYSYHSCGASEFPILLDFAFQVDVTIVNGTGGGFDFRFTGPNNGYLFYISQDGTCTVVKALGASDVTLQHFSKSAINTRPGAHNLLAVLARGNNFELYVNNVHVTSFNDDTYSQGVTSNLAVSASSATADIAFNNTEAWTIA